GRRIVDRSLVERLQNFLRGPLLIGRGFTPRPALGGADHGRRGGGFPGTPHTEARVRIVPAAAERAAALPGAGEIRLAVWSARHNGARLRERARRDQREDHQHADAHMPLHRTSTAGALPPSPVPAGGPNISFLP